MEFKIRDSSLHVEASWLIAILAKDKKGSAKSLPGRKGPREYAKKGGHCRSP